MYSYTPDLVIGSFVLFVNITQINQWNLIGGKKVNVNINPFESTPEIYDSESVSDCSA